MNKKNLTIILCSVMAVLVAGLIVNHFFNWPIDNRDTSGDIGKANRFSREIEAADLSNMEELLKTDSTFKNGIVAAQVVMQTRTVQFGTLLDLSNEVAGNIPAFAEVLKDMNANSEMVNNVASSLAESADNLNAALSGEECPDLAQSSINASLAYLTLQKQNNLATRFIETTDKYLETAQGNDKLKLVRDQWLEYQKTTAAIEGDKASAEALAKKSYLLSGEKALAAVENLDLNIKVAVLQSCELAQAIKLPNQIGSAIRPQVLSNEISKLSNAQKEILARRKKYPYNDLMIGSTSKIFEVFNSALNSSYLPPLNQSEVGNLNLAIGNIISQTAAANNSEKLNKKKQNPPFKEK